MFLAMRKTSLLTLCSALLLISAVQAKDKKPIEWKTGTLLDMTTHKGSRYVGDRDGGYSARNDQSYYEIDDGEQYIYVVRRSMTTRWDKTVVLTVNGPVKFAIDGSNMLLLDDKGKQHKLAIEKRTLKKP
jgi:hypothetical protein